MCAKLQLLFYKLTKYEIAPTYTPCNFEVIMFVWFDFQNSIQHTSAMEIRYNSTLWPVKK